MPETKKGLNGLYKALSNKFDDEIAITFKNYIEYEEFDYDGFAEVIIYDDIDDDLT
eukprot:CAMPEP_0114670148 /NCGR_PEP_ID=MMETSP0191-20121206/39114_1 /TAXON_ID=126664 /ORGANISM="Sorites sp." /LENGTH=55 /DNA_ID=CAMNT_0001927193 /DNA_START=10 /DNA_END=174 /DNA_ORIENTATION=+